MWFLIETVMKTKKTFDQFMICTQHVYYIFHIYYNKIEFFFLNCTFYNMLE